MGQRDRDRKDMFLETVRNQKLRYGFEVIISFYEEIVHAYIPYKLCIIL